jgi:lysophospholipase L1-like esterase
MNTTLASSVTGRMYTKIALLSIVMGALAMPAFSQTSAIPIKSGQSIAFLGDSITDNGWNQTTGYVRLVVSGLQVAGVTVTPVPAGVSGNTSQDMLARLTRDVLSKKPDWMTLSCGVNDVWHGVNGVPLDQYKINITSIVDQAQAAGIKVMIMTSTPIDEDPTNANNTKLADYNNFLKQLAAQDNLPLADVGAAMANVYMIHPGPTHYLTVDGVHPIGLGNEVMAIGILKAFGLNDDQIATAKAHWDSIPNGWQLEEQYNDPDGLRDANNRSLHRLTGYAHLTIAQYEALNATAETQNTTEATVIHDLFISDVKALLAPTGQYASVDAIYAANQQGSVQDQLTTQLNQQLDAQLPPDLMRN